MPFTVSCTCDPVVIELVLLAADPKYTFLVLERLVFVEGHQMLDVLVANEAVDEYRRST